MAKAWEISAALAKSNAKGMGKFDAAVDAAVAKGYGKGKTQLSPPAKGLEIFDAADEKLGKSHACWYQKLQWQKDGLQGKRKGQKPCLRG